MTHTHTTVGKTPLDERSVHCRELHLTTHNIHNRETSMPLAEIETAIPASKGPQTHPLDHSAAEIGLKLNFRI
jgi:hypothetical protein